MDNQNWIVPYERNPKFTGRKAFLELLRERLLDQVPKQFSHRIALYGMGGIGKTQIALEYVYANRDSYERIYWIRAVDQASLLSGYQEIAIKAGLKTLLNLKPMDIAEGVSSWLSREKVGYWLLTTLMILMSWLLARFGLRSGRWKGRSKLKERRGERV